MFKQLRYLRWYYWGRWWIKNRIIQNARKEKKIKIIIGSGKDYGEENEWLNTDIPHFNILDANDWKYFFGKQKIDNLLGEHVMEHLTENETVKALKLAFEYLKPGGIFRIAVPDGFHPNPNYIEYVKPGGAGPGCEDHKVLWNYQTLTKAAATQNFTFNLLEYYNEDGKFYMKEFSISDGYIKRSKRNNFSWGVIKDYTSLIIDFTKIK